MALLLMSVSHRYCLSVLLCTLNLSMNCTTHSSRFANAEMLLKMLYTVHDGSQHGILLLVDVSNPLQG